jgi:adenine deaminase
LAEFGTITTGKRADLILVKDNPLIDVKNLKDIQYVIVRGKVYNKKQLDKMVNDLGAALLGRPLSAVFGV